MHEHRRPERVSNKIEKEVCERKKEGRPNRTFLHLRLNLMILIGLILILQFLNISFFFGFFYFILFSFYLFIFLLLFLALWLFDFVDLLIRVCYLSTCPSIIIIFIWQWSDKSNWLSWTKYYPLFNGAFLEGFEICLRRIIIPTIWEHS